MSTSESALSALRLEAPFFDLGPEFYDVVEPGPVTGTRLRWRNSELLSELGIDPAVTDDALRAAFGEFVPLPHRRHPPLAQRYIGYQFRSFNPYLGDGRGFLLAQVRVHDGRLLDLGTKGSGTTPWSRGGDGRLTLKGGVREVIAAEFLHAMGIKTSRALTLVEHEAQLWRGDEPSPTRASTLVRGGEGHIRFGTFERIFYLVRDPALQKAMMTALAEHVIDVYYPHLIPLPAPDRYVALYREVLERSAVLVAGWTRAGFAHGVLNTDNMSITGDSFDYGPFRFMEDYDPEFTAAYFDESGLYAFERQPDAVHWNLTMLIRPFGVLASSELLQLELARFPDLYRDALRQGLLARLGFEDRGTLECRELLSATLGVLRATGCSFHGLFWTLTDRIGAAGIDEGGPWLPERLWRLKGETAQEAIEAWRAAWWKRWEREGMARGPEGSAEEPAVGTERGLGIDPEREERERASLPAMIRRLRSSNPFHVPYRPEIEQVWEAIDRHDDWEPLYGWLEQLRQPFSS